MIRYSRNLISNIHSKNTPDFRSKECFRELEYTGFEPVASTMRMLRAPNCANTPKTYKDYSTKKTRREV